MPTHLHHISLIMLAAGESSRFCIGDKTYPQGIKLKKQWLRSGLDPLWLLATKTLTQYFDFAKVIIVASSKDFHYMRLINPYITIQGGNTRMQSLKNALNEVSTELVLVSDVARWNSDKHIVISLLEALSENYACAVPYINVADTSFYGADSKNGTYLKRENLKLIQTPQLSRTNDLKVALQTDIDYSDESSALSAVGKNIAFVQGSAMMNKITHVQDLAFHHLAPPNMHTFIGHGVDIHRFSKDKTMLLGGVEITEAFGFEAHSDGDVALHALSNAILGAIGAGDIGEWFPDTDKTYKGADSAQLLIEIYEFAQSVGYELIHIDLSIIAQIPKIAPHKMAIREKIATLLHIPKERVNIKASTSENLGFIGRKEGICVESVVSMRFFNWRSLISLNGTQITYAGGFMINTKEGGINESTSY